ARQPKPPAPAETHPGYGQNAPAPSKPRRCPDCLASPGAKIDAKKAACRPATTRPLRPVPAGPGLPPKSTLHSEATADPCEPDPPARQNPRPAAVPSFGPAKNPASRPASFPATRLQRPVERPVARPP